MEAIFCLNQVVNFLISVAPIIGRLSKGDDIYQIAKYGRYGLLAPDADDLYELSRYGNYVDDVGDAAKKANGAEKIYNANGNPDLRVLRRPQFDEALKNGFPDGTKLNQHAYNSLFKSGRKDIMIDDIIDALKTKPLPADPGSVKYVNPKTGTTIFVNPETNTVVGIWPQKFKQ